MIRKKEKHSHSTSKYKYSYMRSRSDKHRKSSLKSDSNQNHSFKLSSARPISKNMSRLSGRKEHSASARIGVAKKSKVTVKNKDYFGSKKNEAKFNRLKKRSIKNPLNIMNRAIINLNNSRTNSESSQERSSKPREGSSESGKVRYKEADKNQSEVSAFKSKYEEIINGINQKHKARASSKPGLLGQ